MKTTSVKEAQKRDNVALLNKITHTSEEKGLSARAIVAKHNLTSMKYAAAIMFVINVVWFFLDLFSSREYGLSAFWPRTTLITLSVLSIGMIVLSFFSKKVDMENLWIRAAFVFYYLAVIAGVAILTVTRNKLVASNGAISSDSITYIGVGLSSYLLLIIGFFPLPYPVDSTIVIISMLGGMLIPAFTEGRSVYGWSAQIMLRLCIIAVYFMYREANLRTSRKELVEINKNEELKYTSYVDSLTKTYNRRALLDYTNYLWSKDEVKSIGVIMYDIDNFKKYNDYYTHTKGDDILIQISSTIKEMLDDKKEYLFRYGGEEFVVIIENATNETLLQKALAMHAAIWDLNIPRNDGGGPRVTITLGCALVEAEGDSEDVDFIIPADNNLYFGKENGKNCVVFKNEIYGRDVSKAIVEIEQVEKPEEKESAPRSSTIDLTRNKVLIVDDVELNREILGSMIDERFEVIEAEDGAEAVDLMHNYKDSIAVVLLDIVMPKMNGMEVLQYMKNKGWTNLLPVLVISGETNLNTERMCFELGAADFIAKPFNETLVNMRIRNNIDRYQYKEKLEHIVKDQLEILTSQNKSLVEMNEKVIELIAEIVEGRNVESGMHVKRVKEFTRIIANQVMCDYPQYQLTEVKVNNIANASALHDVGKIMIEDSILLKPGKLTAEEFEKMKMHSEYGAEIIEKGKDIWDKDYYQTCYDIAKYHHEKWDGRGYPDKLVGEKIPISAQIVSVADCFDALTTDRVYKKAFSIEEAYKMILSGECGAFSEMLMDCFTKARPKMEKLIKEMKKRGE